MLMICSCLWATAILVPNGTQCMAFIIIRVSVDVNIIGSNVKNKYRVQHTSVIMILLIKKLWTTTILESGWPWATVSKCDLSITDKWSKCNNLGGQSLKAMLEGVFSIFIIGKLRSQHWTIKIL